MMDEATSFELAVLIKNLPLELQERICNELINIIIKDRAALGWTKVHGELLDALFLRKTAANHESICLPQMRP